MIKQISYLLLIILFSSSCFVDNENGVNSFEENQQSSLNAEETVFYEVFGLLLDSIYYRANIEPAFIKDSNDSLILNKGSINYLREDTFTVVLAIYDTLYYEKSNGELLINHFLEENIQIDSQQVTGKRIELTKLITEKKIKLMYSSKFPKGTDIWRKEYDFDFIGVLSFSSVTLDDSQQYGVLSWGYMLWKSNGSGGEIYLRRSKDGWIIDKITENWIS